MTSLLFAAAKVPEPVIGLSGEALAIIIFGALLSIIGTLAGLQLRGVQSKLDALTATVTAQGEAHATTRAETKGAAEELARVAHELRNTQATVSLLRESVAELKAQKRRR